LIGNVQAIMGYKEDVIGQVDEGSGVLVDFEEVKDELVGGISNSLGLDNDGGGGSEVLDVDHEVRNGDLVGLFLFD
jgi:hypothetical protein